MVFSKPEYDPRLSIVFRDHKPKIVSGAVLLRHALYVYVNMCSIVTYDLW